MEEGTDSQGGIIKTESRYRAGKLVFMESNEGAWSSIPSNWLVLMKEYSEWGSMSIGIPGIRRDG